jgi:drug/metabolite transporter (DMT)-like permease
MFKKRLTLKVILFLVFSDVLETFTQFCFKKGAISQAGLEIRIFSDVFNFLSGAFSSGFLWLGLLSVVCTFIIWSTVLSKVDLSVAVPVASFSYILVPLVSIIFLHEKVGILRWSGILFILMGVIFVSLSSKERLDISE